MKLRLLLCVAALVPALCAAPADSLEAGFKNPPQSSRPETWWHWLNGNITKAGIKADLEAMKQIGLGGATIVNADCGIPRGPVEFMSPEWRDDFKYAVQEADRLGLKLGVENCAGWSSSGGPWVTPENSMKRVTTSELDVTGPAMLQTTLPQPPTLLDIYHDVAVLAFPVPADQTVTMDSQSPVFTASTGENPGSRLNDGDPKTFVALPVPRPGQPQFVQVAFAQPFAARLVTITGARAVAEGHGEIEVSDDGRSFHSVARFYTGRGGPNPLVVMLGDQPLVARTWRVRFNDIAARATDTVLPIAEVSLSPRLTLAHYDLKTVAQTSRAELFNLSEPPANPSDSTTGAVPLDGVVNLTSRVDASGKLAWQVPAGHWVVLRVGYTSTGVKNHPAAWGGLGLECDKFSRAALDQLWNGGMQKVLDDVGPLAGRALTSSLVDSYEVGAQNWTDDFAAEFKKRRGYELTPYLAVFTGRVVGSPAISERFLWDIRRTVADLFAENYFGYFTQLCHDHGLQSAIEPYTGPFDSVQSGASADIVMGEFWTGSQGHQSIKLAASIAHIYGKTIVGAESFTSRPPQHGRWQEDPYSLKALGDLMFAQGLNRYVFHRYAMQPWNDRFPGMTMGQWGFHFDRTNTWWNQGKAWIAYITRCEYLLQQGRAVEDVAYFNGENAPVLTRVGNPALPAGYDFDAVNADVLLHGATVKNGRLTLASGANYAALVLPPEDPNMTPDLLARVRDLVRAGATVVGARPLHSPSLANAAKADVEVNRIAGELWGDCDGRTVTEHRFGKGRIVWGRPLADVLAGQALKPDFEYGNGSGESRLAYAHRVDGDTDIYFVSNQRHVRDGVRCIFRVAGKTPQLWHADTGAIEPAPVWSERDGRTSVQLAFDPAGSVFVIFRPAAAPVDHVVEANGSFAPAAGGAAPPRWTVSQPEGAAPVVTAFANGTVALRTASGRALRAVATDVPAAVELAGPWTLSFPPHWGAPASVSLDRLMSWTQSGEAGVRYFSGTATYTKELDIPAADLASGREVWLDLGQVKNLAEVSVDGHDLGVLWKPPFRVNLTAAAHAGTNQLVVKVTNLWPNRLIGDEQLPPDVVWDGLALKAWPQWFLDGKPSPTGRLTFTTWHHWTKDSPLLESGLLGPVRLEVGVTVPAQ